MYAFGGRSAFFGQSLGLFRIVNEVRIDEREEAYVELVPQVKCFCHAAMALEMFQRQFHIRQFLSCVHFDMGSRFRATGSTPQPIVT